MRELLNEAEKEMEMRRKRRRLVLLSLLIFLTLTSAYLFVIYRRYSSLESRFPQNVQYTISEGVEEIIKSGDDAFRAYKYDDALARYQLAKWRLSGLIEFESNSPSKNENLLQHYYNIGTLLKARIELTSITEKVSRSTPSSSNQPPATTNESKP